jgi:chemotaxis response regulator CheB
MLPAMLERHLANVRVLVVNVPRLLSDVMSGIMASDSEIEIVSEVGETDMLSAIAALEPDVVVFSGEADEAKSNLARIGASYPMLRVVSVDADGRAATIHEPGVAARRITDISPLMMLSLIRGSAG